MQALVEGERQIFAVDAERPEAFGESAGTR